MVAHIRVLRLIYLQLILVRWIVRTWILLLYVTGVFIPVEVTTFDPTLLRALRVAHLPLVGHSRFVPLIYDGYICYTLFPTFPFLHFITLSVDCYGPLRSGTLFYLFGDFDFVRVHHPFPDHGRSTLLLPVTLCSYDSLHVSLLHLFVPVPFVIHYTSVILPIP